MLIARKEDSARVSRPSKGPSVTEKSCSVSGSRAAGFSGVKGQHSLRYHSRYLQRHTKPYQYLSDARRFYDVEADGLLRNSRDDIVRMPSAFEAPTPRKECLVDWHWVVKLLVIRQLLLRLHKRGTVRRR